MTRLEGVAATYQAATEALRAARDDLRAAVIEAAESGTPETQLAKIAGVTRMTIRAWLGK